MSNNHSKALAQALREAVFAMAYYAEDDHAAYDYPALDEALRKARPALAAYDADQARYGGEFEGVAV